MIATGWVTFPRAKNPSSGVHHREVNRGRRYVEKVVENLSTTSSVSYTESYRQDSKDKNEDEFSIHYGGSFD